MKEPSQKKASGFPALVACIVLSAVTLCAYAFIYSRTRFMSWTGFGIMAAGIVLALVLIFAKLTRFAPGLLLLTNFAALLFHVYYIYFFISSVVTGIQFSGFPLDFYINFILFGLTLVLSIVCVFLPVEADPVPASPAAEH